MNQKEIKTISFYSGTYTGELLLGKPHGHGRVEYPDGTYYEGEWQMGQAHGKGFKDMGDGETFEGEWHLGRWKQGKWIFGNDFTYEGEFADSQPHGYGVKTWSSGRYAGEWKKGFYHGIGTLTSAEGVWEGKLEEGYINGKGVYTSQEGWVFAGHFVQLKRTGNGRITYPNGDVYDGDVGLTYSMSSLAPHGKGTYHYADGRQLTDEFQHGKSCTERMARQEAEEKRQEEARLAAQQREEEERQKDPAAYQAARRKALREQLEKDCRPLFGSEEDIAKRFAILQDAFFQAHNAGFIDSMAWRLASGREDSSTDFWKEACRLKREVEQLCDIYREELEIDENT